MRKITDEEKINFFDTVVSAIKSNQYDSEGIGNIATNTYHNLIVTDDMKKEFQNFFSDNLHNN